MSAAPPQTGDAVAAPRLGRWLVASLVAAVFVLVAVWLEMAGGSRANSPVPDWAYFAPIAWPQGARVVWWLAVAAAAGLFRLGLARLEISDSKVVTVATVAPFVIFAGGIAVGADWATWH